MSRSDDDSAAAAMIIIAPIVGMMTAEAAGTTRHDAILP
jgi:hypothetical protein